MTFGKRRNKITEEEDEDTTAEEQEESSQKLKINLGQLLGGAGSKDPRILGLFGSVEEEKHMVDQQMICSLSMMS
jgi:hypothetical protein